jgi:hypothetical protein
VPIKNEYLVTAELNNGNKIFIEPDFYGKKVYYQYISEDQMLWGGMPIPNDKGIWLETQIQTTVDGGIRYIFCVVDATPIVLNRIKEV